MSFVATSLTEQLLTKTAIRRASAQISSRVIERIDLACIWFIWCKDRLNNEGGANDVARESLQLEIVTWSSYIYQ